jgi:dihydrofolate synthase/folylpolyglutamate synthase
MKLPKWPDPNKIHHIELGLERILKLLDRLGNPHQKLPPTIHIAGTNGKGSTLAFLKNIYESAGYKVHRYTSPHLIEFNERIEIAGKKICDEQLQKYLDICQIACNIEPKIDITFFEATTAVAFLAFSENFADILLLETGMGGEFDATNVLSQVMQAIITPISFDHQQFLGKTLAKIAVAKAGIIKTNCPTISSKQEPEALEVIKQTVIKKNSKLIFTDEFFSKIDFDLSKINISLAGNHQIENVITAICSIKQQNHFKITDDDIKNGIEKTTWRARLEKISHGKLYQRLNKNFELILDGSHNLQGAKTINDFLKKSNFSKKIIIFQMMQDKDCQNFLKEISQQYDFIYINQGLKGHKFFEDGEIAKIMQNLKIPHKFLANFSKIFDEINDKFKEFNSLVLITGSLYQASEFLIENDEIYNKI